MSQKSARLSADKIFRQETLSFENIPNQSQLFLDFLADSEKTKKFYPEKNTPLANFSEQVLRNYKIDRNHLCDALAEINDSFGAGNKTFESIKLLREKDCVTVVTGQQAGLFSGALYTIYKALSAVKIADDLRKKQIKAVPIFWLAEEDHDFDEVKKTYNLDKEGKLIKSENTPRNYVENFPVGLVGLDETIKETIGNLFDSLPHSEFTDEVKRLLEETYQADQTYSTAFGKYIARIFSDYGLIILSPVDGRLKKLCAPIFVEAIENSDTIISALLERNLALEMENYTPQVLVTKDNFPFFYQNKTGERQSLRLNLENGKIKIQKSKAEFSKSELLEIARSAPENLSPNALMRPIVQDYLLPTVLYFGGAAEIAYFAQNSVIYKTLNRPVTPVRHRASLTVVERKHAKTLEKYELSFSGLFEGTEKIKAQIVEKFLDKDTAQVFTDIEEIINAQLDRLDRQLTSVEPTLSASLVNRRRKILWHIGVLRKKYHRAEILKDEIAQRRIENLFIALLPGNALQERTLNVITFLNLYGENFINWIYEAIEPDEKSHQILYF